MGIPEFLSPSTVVGAGDDYKRTMVYFEREVQVRVPVQPFRKPVGRQGFRQGSDGAVDGIEILRLLFSRLATVATFLPAAGSAGQVAARCITSEQLGGAVMAGQLPLSRQFPILALMITAKQIRELLQAKPFKPFRICLSDRTHYDITNHDMAFVTKNTVEVGINLDAKGFAEYVARCSLLDITKLEDLPETIAR